MQPSYKLMLLLAGLVTTVLSHPCQVHRTKNYVAVDCVEKNMNHVPQDIPTDTTDLNMGGNAVSVIRTNAFAYLHDLRILDLSSNDINTIEPGSFSGLRKLHVLNLAKHRLNRLPDDVFDPLSSLQELSISSLNSDFQYPVLPVNTLTQLTALSLHLLPNFSLPSTYRELRSLTNLDFYCGHGTVITYNMLEGLRSLPNVTSLGFRSNSIYAVEAGAFSNFSNLQVINLACNYKLNYRDVVRALADTVNANVRDVILDGINTDELSVLNVTEMCSKFWNNVKRLSIKNILLYKLDLRKRGCLRNMEHLSMAYNPSFLLSFPVFYGPDVFTNLVSVDLSIQYIEKNNYFKQNYCWSDASLMVHADQYFRKIPVLSELKLETPFKKDTIFPNTLQFVYASKFQQISKKTCKSTEYATENNIRYINISDSRIIQHVDCLLLGLDRLQMFDSSKGDIRSIRRDFFHHFPNLCSLNLSHNLLGLTDTSLQGWFRHGTLLRDVDVSHNELTRIDTGAFSSCRHLRRVKLNNNKLAAINIKLNNDTTLELLDLGGNRLHILEPAFREHLDSFYGQNRQFKLDIRDNVFVCGCSSIEFIDWLQRTPVDLIGRDKLRCRHGHNANMTIVDLSVGALRAECWTSYFAAIITICLLAVVLVIFVLLLRYHRWYIMYHVTLCRLRRTRGTDYTAMTQHDVMAVYFLHPIGDRSDWEASQWISRWVCSELRSRAEDDWGLRLYIGDRDDLGGDTKLANFVRGSHSSERLLVCLTPELVKDHLISYLATDMKENARPLCHYTFIVFDDADKGVVLPYKVAELLHRDSPAVVLRRDVSDESFWRDLRKALLRDRVGDQNRLLNCYTKTTSV